MSPTRRLRAGLPAVLLLAGTVLVGARLPAALAPAATGVGARPLTPLLTASGLEDVSTPPAGFEGPTRVQNDRADGAASRRTWFAMGRWWAVFAGGSTDALHIWALSGRSGPWVDTGVSVDDRPFAEPWVAWTGTDLVVSTTGDRSYRDHGLRFDRFTWSTSLGRWVQAADFPVQVTDTGVPGSQTVLDGEGHIWSAHLEGDRLLVAHSDLTGLTFTAFAPPVEASGSDVGSFSLTTMNGLPQLAWRSVHADRFTVASQNPGGQGWDVESHDVYGLRGTGSIEIAPAGPTRPGTLVVLAATSLAQRGTNDQDPSVLLMLVRGRRVDTSVVAVGANGLGSPRLSVDGAAGTVHVVAVVSEPAPEPGAPPSAEMVTDKVTRLSDLTFGIGSGRTLLSGGSTRLMTPIVAPATSAASGLLVATAPQLPGSWRTVREGGVDPGATPASGAGDPLLHDTFDQLPLGGPAPQTWFSDGSGPLRATIGAAVAGGRSLVLGPGGAGSGACRKVPQSAAPVVTVRADVVVEGLGTADVRLLTVKGQAGSLASVRLTRKGIIGFSAPGGRTDQALVGSSAALRVTIRIDRANASADLRVDRPDGTPLFAVTGQALLSNAGSGPDEVCLAPAPGSGAGALALADLVVNPA